MCKCKSNVINVLPGLPSCPLDRCDQSQTPGGGGGGVYCHQKSARAHLHKRGAGPPAGSVSVFCVGRVFTLARVRAQFQFAEAPFCVTGPLIYKYWPISAPYSCGSRRRITPWTISAGACRGPAAEAQRTRGGVNSTTQFLQTNPLRSPWAGSLRAFRAFSRVGVNAP